MTNPKQNLSANIISTLKDRIIQWEYFPGHRLTEEEICKEFGVSRSPVREALRVLVANGFIEKKIHQGYTIKQLDAKEIKDLYELRMALEIYVVERLAETGISERKRKQLAHNWRSVLGKRLMTEEELSALDQSFHESLAVEMGNQVFARQLMEINERLSIFRIIDFAKADRIQSTARQHLKVLECINARDIEGAREAIISNIQDSRDNVHTTITEALGRAYQKKQMS